MYGLRTTFDDYRPLEPSRVDSCLLLDICGLSANWTRFQPGIVVGGYWNGKRIGRQLEYVEMATLDRNEEGG